MPSTAIFFYKNLVSSEKVCTFAAEIDKKILTMALQRGPFGSGYIKKLGQTVGFKAGDGEYGIRAYQPMVTNPRTEAQTSQRARFNWCAKMAAVLGNEALVGLSNQREHTVRQAFSALNIDRLQMNSLINPEQVDALGSAMQIKLSMGSVVWASPVLTSSAHNVIGIHPESFYGQEANRPDELIVVAIIVERLQEEGYRAAWMRIPYTNFTDGIASADDVKLMVSMPVSSQQGFTQECVAYCYNVKYNSNTVRYSYGGLKAVKQGEEVMIGTVDTMKRLTRGDQFSTTQAQYMILENQ